MPIPNPKLLRSTAHCAVGRHSYGRPEILLFPSSPYPAVVIGAFCSIADDVLFITGGEHDMTRFTTYPLETLFDNMPPVEHSKGRITVGNDVWIGARATILSGVTIGDGACIGAGSVIARDVQPYTIVAGNPARVIGFRESPGVPWWDWPLDEIEKLTKGMK